MEVNLIPKLGSIPSLSETGAINDNHGVESFKNVLANVLEQTNAAQNESKALGEALATGMTDNIQQVMIAGEKANVMLQLTMQIRTKILDAYNEIMRMQM